MILTTTVTITVTSGKNDKSTHFYSDTGDVMITKVNIIKTRKFKIYQVSYIVYHNYLDH